VLHRLAVSYGQKQRFATSDHSSCTSPDADHKEFRVRPEISADGSSKQLFLQPMRMYIENNTFTTEPKAQIALSLLYGSHGPYWYHSSARKLFTLIRAMFVVGSARTLTTNALSVSKSGRTLAHKSAHSSLRYVTNAFRFTDLRAYNRLYFSLLKIPICNQYTARTVQLHVQSELIIPEANFALTRPTTTTGSRKVRCRLLRSKSSSSDPVDQTLVFHCHGGGFVITSPDAHEVSLIVFLFVHSNHRLLLRFKLSILI
jgi:hypothetical protein